LLHQNLLTLALWLQVMCRDRLFSFPLCLNPSPRRMCRMYKQLDPQNILGCTHNINIVIEVHAWFTTKLVYKTVHCFINCQ
jgi:hypothetical protein